MKCVSRARIVLSCILYAKIRFYVHMIRSSNVFTVLLICTEKLIFACKLHDKYHAC